MRNSKSNAFCDGNPKIPQHQSARSIGGWVFFVFRMILCFCPTKYHYSNTLTRGQVSAIPVLSTLECGWKLDSKIEANGDVLCSTEIYLCARLNSKMFSWKTSFILQFFAILLWLKVTNVASYNYISNSLKRVKVCWCWSALSFVLGVKNERFLKQNELCDSLWRIDLLI